MYTEKIKRALKHFPNLSTHLQKKSRTLLADASIAISDGGQLRLNVAGGLHYTLEKALEALRKKEKMTKAHRKAAQKMSSLIYFIEDGMAIDKVKDNMFIIHDIIWCGHAEWKNKDIKSKLQKIHYLFRIAKHTTNTHPDNIKILMLTLIYISLSSMVFGHHHCESVNNIE